MFNFQTLSKFRIRLLWQILRLNWKSLIYPQTPINTPQTPKMLQAKDNSQALLMAEFYRRLKETSKPTKAEAMQQAQRALLQGTLKAETNDGKRDVGVVTTSKNATLPAFQRDEKAPFSHPFYWSPFVLIGNCR